MKSKKIRLTEKAQEVLEDGVQNNAFILYNGLPDIYVDGFTRDDITRALNWYAKNENMEPDLIFAFLEGLTIGKRLRVKK